MRILNELPKEAISGLADWRLVRDRGDDQSGAIMISCDHFVPACAVLLPVRHQKSTPPSNRAWMTFLPVFREMN
jgi:hypothetical protein